MPTPTPTTAAGSTGSSGLDTFIGKVESAIIDPLITLVVLAAFILFAYGMLQFIMGAGDEEKRSIGKKHMIWGIIGLVIIFGAQTLKEILKNIVGAK